MSADVDGVGAETEGSDGRDRTPRSGGLRSALTNRNFVPYLAGNVLSQCGTWFQNIAQTLLVYRLTGSVFLVGVVNLAQFAGVFLVGPWAGVVADQWDRRKLLMCTQIFGGSVTAGLAVVSATGRATVPVVFGVALVLGIAQAFSVPSMLALVPQLVGPQDLAVAVSLNIVTFNVARAVGPVLGAVVVATFGVSIAFAVNAISFTALAVALLVVRPIVGRQPATERPRLRETLGEVRARRDLKRVFLVGACASIAIDPVTTLTPEFATEVFGREDTLVGWFVGAFGTGAVLAGLWVSRRPQPSDRVLGARLLCLTGSLAAFAVTPWLVVATMFLVSAGFWFIGLSAAALARLQRSTPPTSHGRLMALWSMAFMGSRPIAALVGGGLATGIGVRLATLIVAAPAVLLGLRLVTWGGRHRAPGEHRGPAPGVVTTSSP